MCGGNVELVPAKCTTDWSPNLWRFDFDDSDMQNGLTNIKRNNEENTRTHRVIMCCLRRKQCWRLRSRTATCANCQHVAVFWGMLQIHGMETQTALVFPRISMFLLTSGFQLILCLSNQQGGHSTRKNQSKPQNPGVLEFPKRSNPWA